jgi:type IV secretion system protein VirB5
MKLLNKKIALVALAASLFVSNAFATGIPVVDAAHVAETVAGWAAQAEHMGSQLSQLKQQYQQMQQQYQSLTGSRGMSDLMNSSAFQQARRMLPPDAQQALNLANGGSYGNLGNAINDIKQAATTLSTDSFSSPTAANQWQTELNQAATNKALSMEAYTAAAQRLQNLEDMTAEISQTQDPKAIAELQARIATEQGMIQNEQSKLQALSMLAAAEKQLADQQANEISIKSGSVANIPRIQITP